MSIQCQSLLKIPSLREIKILAGHEGLGRNVRWVYIWDILSEVDDVTNWIYGNELLIVSEHMLDGSYDVFMEILPQLNKMNVSGIIINAKEQEASVPKNIIDESNRLGLPLFSLPWSEKIINITHDICYLLAQEEMEKKTKSNVLEKILFDTHVDGEAILTLTQQMGYEFDHENVIGIINITNNMQIKDYYEWEFSNNVFEYIQTSVNNAFASRNIKILTLIRNNDIIIMMPFGRRTSSITKEVFKDVFLTTNIRFKGFSFRAGFGNAHKDLKDMHESYHQAEQAVRYMKAEKSEQLVAYYSEIGIYSLLMAVKKRSVLKEFYYNAFGTIIEYDNSNNSDLMVTLENYLNHNLDIQLAANAMHIHKNTMRYRIAKIQELLGCDMKEMGDIIRLGAAIKAGRLVFYDEND